MKGLSQDRYDGTFAGEDASQLVLGLTFINKCSIQLHTFQQLSNFVPYHSLSFLK